MTDEKGPVWTFADGRKLVFGKPDGSEYRGSPRPYILMPDGETAEATPLEVMAAADMLIMEEINGGPAPEPFWLPASGEHHSNHAHDCDCLECWGRPGFQPPPLDPQLETRQDELHPAGRCTCAGGGTCEWCGRTCPVCGGDCCFDPCEACNSTGYRPEPDYEALGYPETAAAIDDRIDALAHFHRTASAALVEYTIATGLTIRNNDNPVEEKVDDKEKDS